ncbi:SprT family zinc-dependent metalloprotease [Verrucomicrobiales bacterium BCK34]|nr:SprT family zinc-dependent metalloprotease [Verrucomicrobiales bacterium BCK34]
MRSSRKTLAISVLPDGDVELVAPENAKTEDIIAKVEKRAGWISAKRWEFSQLNVSKPELIYRSGATHRYLGKQYRLKVRKAERSDVKLKGAFFHIEVPEKTEAEVERLLNQWMREKALTQFTTRLSKWDGWCARNNLPTPKLQLRSMSKRWGSSHPAGKILLNPDLVRTPSLCVDYVIAHEVCHLKEPNHNTAFFKLLDQVFPNWRDVKLRLEQAEF